MSEINLEITINSNGDQLVDARHLHTELNVGREFSKWIKKNLIDSPFFAEGEDYVRLEAASRSPILASGKFGSKEQQINYALTLDTAKKLAMATDTDKGDEIKNYFLECERRVKEVVQEVPQTKLEWMKLAIEVEEEKEKLLIESSKKDTVITKKLEIIEEQDEVIDELKEDNFVKEQIIGGGLEPQDYALRINGANSKQINKFLIDINWQRKVGTYDTPEIHISGYTANAAARGKFLVNKRKHKDYVNVVCYRKVGVMLTELGAEEMYKIYLDGGKKYRGVWYEFPMLKSWDGKFTRPRLID